MRSPAADDLLDAVGRRLRRQGLVAAAGFAAWIAVAISAIAVLLHLVVRPMGASDLLITIVIVCAGAALQARAKRARTADLAEWTDRHLGGRSAFSTYVECRTRDVGTGSGAMQRLVEWLDEAVPRARRELDAIAFDAGLLKPVAAAAVAVVIALVVLQVPSQTRTSTSAREATAASGPDLPASATLAVAVERDAAATSGEAATTAERETKRRKNSGRAPAPATPDARAADEPTADAAPHTDSPAASAAAAGGRDAGSSVDDAAEEGLSTAWQGKLATSLRSLSRSSDEGGRADASLAAEFEPSSTTQAAASTPVGTVAAAAPGVARGAAPAGPAEQAYVRAYFDGSGARP